MVEASGTIEGENRIYEEEGGITQEEGRGGEEGGKKCLDPLATTTFLVKEQSSREDLVFWEQVPALKVKCLEKEWERSVRLTMARQKTAEWWGHGKNCDDMKNKASMSGD